MQAKHEKTILLTAISASYACLNTSLTHPAIANMELQTHSGNAILLLPQNLLYGK